MQIITNDENKIILFIKNNLDKYPEKVSYDEIRGVLDFSETKMVDLLDSLQQKKIIEYDASTKEVSYVNLDVDLEVVENQSELKKYMLNKTEEDAYIA